MKKNLLIVALTVFYFTSQAQRVGIGTNNPHSSAQLDVSATNKGVLVPRMALSAANVAAPVTSPADALLIFNTATAGTGENAVSPGFYYWSSTNSRWMTLAGSAPAAAAGDVGYGAWGDCSVTAISEYQPAVSADGRAGDIFGALVSISGNFAIVGAPFDTVGANAWQGSAYIFSFDGTKWQQQQKLLANDGTVNDLFGYSVSISGNYAIVGAPREDDGPLSSDRGAAYIFFYNGNTWVQQQKITPSDGAINDYFGLSVAITSSYALVGANNKTIAGKSKQGSAYIFHNNAGVWTQKPPLLASDGDASDQFGYSASLSGNYAVVGAPFDLPVGAAYVFFYNGTNWVQQQKLKPSDPNAGFFGTAVSISGTTILAGSETNIVGGSNAQGAAYIFGYTGSIWEQQQQIISGDGKENDRFGKNVSLSGDYALISAPQSDVGGSVDQGVTYLYQNAGGFWIKRQKIINPSGAGGDFSGICSISNGRFIIGNSSFSLQRGQVIFGKVNE